MTIANANALFQGLKTKASFTKTITIERGDPEDILLRESRKKIRGVIRNAFGGFEGYFRDSNLQPVLLNARDHRFVALAKNLKSLDVRFLTQGSHAYRTLIRPALPNQEIDLDDGIYVSLPFVGGRPLLTSEGLFQIIERALAQLVESEGWTLKRKDTCVRIQIAPGKAHIDLPLFAVEREGLNVVLLSAQKALGEPIVKTSRITDLLDGSFRKSLSLAEGSILLAVRGEEDWRKSDPKAIHDWFTDQVDVLGAVVRRLCRYSKAWRDYKLGNCALSSLALMVMCVEALAAMGERPSENRDDLLLLKVVSQFPAKLTTGGLVWRKGESPLDENWTDVERKLFVNSAKAFADTLNSALQHKYDREQIVLAIQGELGKRFPNAPESIDITRGGQTAEVLETKASVVAMPTVGTSVSA
jgi:hypothetical protein